MRRLDYAVLIEPLSEEDGGGFLATVPDLPGCMSDRETREAAAQNMEDAIARWLEEAKAVGRDIPETRPTHHLTRSASRSPAPKQG
jgi:antitoxin HicB